MLLFLVSMYAHCQYNISNTVPRVQYQTVLAAALRLAQNHVYEEDGEDLAAARGIRTISNPESNEPGRILVRSAGNPQRTRENLLESNPQNLRSSFAHWPCSLCSLRISTCHQTIHELGISGSTFGGNIHFTLCLRI